MTDYAYLLVLLAALGFLAGLSVGRAWGYRQGCADGERATHDEWGRWLARRSLPPQQRKPTP